MTKIRPTTNHALVALSALLLMGVSAPLPAEAADGHQFPAWAADPPQGFIAPPIHPAGVQLETRQLAPGVYGLVSGHGFVDNNGFIVGERGVLVIDAHINAAMAGQIQDAVRAVTDKPILYLVNTNYHGDHTFGNYAFPATTQIIAHRQTAARMVDFEAEKALMLRTVNDDPAVFGDAELRLPDMVFDDYLRIDLGGRVVELHHFGAGNTPGDTVVYAADARVAWTGNLVVGEGTIPPIFETDAATHLATIARFARTLDVETIIPGHGFPTTGANLGRYMTYLSDLLERVRVVVRQDASLADALATVTLAETYLPPEGSPQADVRPFLIGLHRMNVQQTYQAIAN